MKILCVGMMVCDTVISPVPDDVLSRDSVMIEPPILSCGGDELHKDAVRKGMAEETRMLYVAMTRAVNKLILLVNDWDSYESWSSLIRKVGLIDE